MLVAPILAALVLALPLASSPASSSPASSSPASSSPAQTAATAAVTSPPPTTPAASTSMAFLDAQRASSMRDALNSDDVVLAAGGFARAYALFDHVDDDGLADAFVDDVARRARNALARAHALRVRAERAAARGDFAAADADLDALGHPRALLCIGPFANTGGAGFGAPTPADDVAATLDTSVDGLDRPVQWRTVPREARGGYDVGSRFVARREVRALCAFAVDVDQAGPVAVRSSASGAVAVRAGAVVVSRVDSDRPVGFDQDAGAVFLPKGRSIVVLEAGFRSRGGSVDVRLTKLDGSPLRFRASAQPADVAAAARARGAPRAIDARDSVLAHASIDPVLAARDADADHLRAAAALALRTRAYDQQAKPPAVEVLLERLIAAPGLSATERASALTRLGTARAARDRSSARALYEQALAVDPTSAGATAGLAELLHNEGHEAEARALWQRVVALAPASSNYRNARWRFERQEALLGAAIDDAILAAAAGTRDDDLLAIAADVLDDRGDHAGACALLTRSRDAGQRALVCGELHEARLAADPGALPAAIDALRLRLRLAPGSHNAAEKLLLRLVDADRSFARATAFVTERRALFPDRPEPLELAARLALLKGERATARQHFASALALTPEDGDLQRTARAFDDDADDALASTWLPAFDDDAVARARREVPADGKAFGAWVASRAVATRFFDNGLLRRYEDTVVVVDDAMKGEGFRAFPFSYAGDREQVDIVVAERIRADGRREPAERVVDRGQEGKENGAYSDARSKIVVFSAVEAGDVLHVRVRHQATGLQNLFGDFFGDIEVIQGRFPVKRFRYVVEAPRGRPLFADGRDAPQPIVSERDDSRIYDFVADDIPGVDAEVGMPAWLEYARYLSVSTYGSWSELGRWYEDLIREQLRLDDDLRGIAARFKGQARDDAELVRLLYEYVVTETRYVGIELGIHGWKPYPVTEVHRRRYGDCKDKASLLVALLREAGLEAHLALVRTIQLGHAATSPPSMWSFNHAIAYVPKLDLFLDGTAEHSGWRELPTMDQGGLALIVDGASSHLVTIPVQGAEANLNTSEYVLTLRDDGALVVDGTERFRGSQNQQQRQAFADPATQRTTLERQLGASIAGTAVASIEVSSLALAAEETSYHFRATLPGRAARQPDGSFVMPLSLYPHDLAGNYAGASRRRFELFLDHPWRTRNVLRYVLPKGLRPVDLPRGGRVDGRFVRFVQQVTPTPDGFVVDEDTSIVVRRIPAAEYETFRAEALAADQLMKRTLHLVAGGR